MSLRAHGVSPKIFAALEDAPSDKVRVFNWYKKNGLERFVYLNALFLTESVYSFTSKLMASTTL